MSNESHTQAFWLVPNVTNAQKRVPKYPRPWARDSEITTSYILLVLLPLTRPRMSVPNYRQNNGFLENCSRFQSMLMMFK